MSVSSLFAYPTESMPDPLVEPPFLGHWTHGQWQKLLALTQTYRYSAGEWVIRQGATERALYLVAFGRLEVIGAAGDKAHQRHAIMEAGAIVGEHSFLDGRPQPLAVRALTEAEAVRLSFEAFESFAAREPNLARDLALAIGQVVSLRFRAVAGY